MNEKLKFNIKVTNEKDGKREVMEEPEVGVYMKKIFSVREENELEKDYFFRENFNKAKEIVRKIVEYYGVKAFDVLPKMVHILPHEDYLKFNGPNTGACTLGTGIYINQKYYKNWDELTKFMAFCHELLHANSYQKIERKEIEPKEYKVKSVRTGARLKRNSADEFRGLNEAITVYLTNVLYFHDVKDKFEFSQNRPKPAENIELLPAEDNFNHYKHLEKLFIDICYKIDENPPVEYESEKPVGRLFIRVYFNGGIEQIGKLIMSSLGSDALNSLAKINDQKDKENLMRIVNFRKKYGLPEDAELNEYVKGLNKRSDERILKNLTKVRKPYENTKVKYYEQ